MTVSRPVSPSSPARAVRLATVDDPEFARILRIGDPAPALEDALTFLPPTPATVPEWMNAWQEWQTSLFAQTLVPMLLNIAANAAEGRAREILKLDAELDAALETPDRARSAAAGQRLLARLNGARGDRWLGKLLAAAAEGRFAAHFLTIHACQSALFHLPLRLLPASYAYWEWCAALSVHPPANAVPLNFDAATPLLRQLVETHSPSVPAADARSVFRIS